MKASKIYNTLLIDTNEIELAKLEKLLLDFLPQIKIIGFAKDLRTAKNILSNHHIDIVFIDTNLGNESGISFISNYTNRKFEVIYVSVFTRYALDALKSGASGFIIKPIFTQNLIDEVNRVCALIYRKKL